MLGVSRGVRVGEVSRLSRLADFCSRILVPAGASLTLLAIAISSAREVDHDLRLTAPDRIVAGQSVPVRVQLYAGLHRPQGAHLIAPKVTLELRAASGTLLASRTMNASYAHSLDAMLLPPQGYTGEARLTALALIDAAPRSE